MATILCLALLVIIAIFVNDGFIRPYLGDVLVVVFVYCALRSIVEIKLGLLPLFVFVFATLVEIGQYFHLVEFLGLQDNPIARIALGSTFDIADIICYAVGCAGLLVMEILANLRMGRGKPSDSNTSL